MDKRRVISLIAALTAMPIAFAGGLSDSDAGTYEYREKSCSHRCPLPTLSFKREMGGIRENTGKEWKNISCDAGCEYRNSTAKEIQSYFPPDWLAGVEIACIQNTAQAFCRFSPNRDAGKAGHVVVALVTGKPIPIWSGGWMAGSCADGRAGPQSDPERLPDEGLPDVCVHSVRSSRLICPVWQNLRKKCKAYGWKVSPRFSMLTNSSIFRALVSGFFAFCSRNRMA